MAVPPLNLRTAAQLIHRSSVSFVSNLYTFLTLSLLLFFFRNSVENGTLFLTDFLDRDPSVQTLISRLTDSRQNLAGNDAHLPDSVRSPAAAAAAGNHRRRPFLHLSRVGTLDDDFFSDDNDGGEGNLYGFHRGHRSLSNGSFVNPSRFFRREAKVGFPEFRFIEGIRVSEFIFDESDGDSNGTAVPEKEPDRGDERPVDLWLFGHGFELDTRDAAKACFLVSFLSGLYSWMILGFVFSYSCVLGVVFFAVANSYLGKYSSGIRKLWSGSRLGFHRLWGYMLLRWAMRDTLAQLLGLWFFSDVDDLRLLFKLFVRWKLMPFFVSPSHWIHGPDIEVDMWGFMFAWFLLDNFISFVFAVDCWVSIMDTRRSGREVVKEGCYLISTMLNPAILIKCYESILCGSAVRWALARTCGELFGGVFQAALEVYFMVVWLTLYFAARCEDGEHGRRFGQRELEDCIDGLR